MLAVNE